MTTPDPGRTTDRPAATPDIAVDADASPAAATMAPQQPAARRSARILRSMVRRTYPILLVLAVWEMAARLELVDPFFVPPFTHVLEVWVDALFSSGSMWPHIVASLYRALVGLVLAAVVGVLAGLLMGRVQKVADFVDPLVAVTFPMPKLALFPLLILWLGIGDASKIALIFLAAVFPVLINTYMGVRGVNKLLVWNAMTKGASSTQIMFKVVLPAAFPQMFAGLRVASSLAFLLIVASEMIAANSGLGYLIVFSQRTFKPDMAFAGVLTIALLGYLFDRAINLAGKRLLAWQDAL